MRIISTPKLLGLMLGSIIMRVTGFSLCILSALMLAGCVSAQETYTADGGKGHVISCTPAWTGGLVGSIAQCVNVLGYLLPEGWGSLRCKGLHSAHALGRAYL